MTWSTRFLAFFPWLVPGLVALGTVVGVAVHFALPGGHPPLSAYVFAPTVLLALVLSPFTLAAALVLLYRGAAGSSGRLRAAIAAVLNAAIFFGCFAIWRAG